MGEATFTPGSWELGSVTDGEGRQLPHRAYVTAGECDIELEGPNAAANAALIAVAPDLYRELVEIAEDLASFADSGTPPHPDWVADNLGSIRDLLAKARGES